MRDWNDDGFPDPVPWHHDGLGCSGCLGVLVMLGLLAAVVYLVINA